MNTSTPFEVRPPPGTTPRASDTPRTKNLKELRRKRLAYLDGQQKPSIEEHQIARRPSPPDQAISSELRSLMSKDSRVMRIDGAPAASSHLPPTRSNSSITTASRDVPPLFLSQEQPLSVMLSDTSSDGKENSPQSYSKSEPKQVITVPSPTHTKSRRAGDVEITLSSCLSISGNPAPVAQLTNDNDMPLNSRMSNTNLDVKSVRGGTKARPTSAVSRSTVTGSRPTSAVSRPSSALSRPSSGTNRPVSASKSGGKKSQTQTDKRVQSDVDKSARTSKELSSRSSSLSKANTKAVDSGNTDDKSKSKKAKLKSKETTQKVSPPATEADDALIWENIQKYQDDIIKSKFELKDQSKLTTKKELKVPLLDSGFLDGSPRNIPTDSRLQVPGLVDGNMPPLLSLEPDYEMDYSALGLSQNFSEFKSKDLPLTESVNSASGAKVSSSLASVDHNNLAGILGKDRMNRLIRNLEESDWSMGDSQSGISINSPREVESIRSDTFSDQTSPLSRKNSEISARDIDVNLAQDGSDVGLELQTHRPSGSINVIESNQQNKDYLGRADDYIQSVKERAKVAFSSEQIYAEAGESARQSGELQSVAASSHISPTSSQPPVFNPHNVAASGNRTLTDQSKNSATMSRTAQASTHVSPRFAFKEEVREVYTKPQQPPPQYDQNWQQSNRYSHIPDGSGDHSAASQAMDGAKLSGMLFDHGKSSENRELADGSDDDDGSSATLTDNESVTKGKDTLQTDLLTNRESYCSGIGPNSKPIGPIRRLPLAELDASKRLDPTTKQHIDGIKKHMTIIANPELPVPLPPGEYFSPSIERYFSSLEHLGPNAQVFSTSQFEPVPEPLIDDTPRTKLEHTSEAVSNSQTPELINDKRKRNLSGSSKSSKGKTQIQKSGSPQHTIIKNKDKQQARIPADSQQNKSGKDHDHIEKNKFSVPEQKASAELNSPDEPKMASDVKPKTFEVRISLSQSLEAAKDPVDQHLALDDGGTQVSSVASNNSKTLTERLERLGIEKTFSTLPRYDDGDFDINKDIEKQRDHARQIFSQQGAPLSAAPVSLAGEPELVLPYKTITNTEDLFDTPSQTVHSKSGHQSRFETMHEKSSAKSAIDQSSLSKVPSQQKTMIDKVADLFDTNHVPSFPCNDDDNDSFNGNEEEHKSSVRDLLELSSSRVEFPGQGGARPKKDVEMMACPDCGEMNKTYLTWCIECGAVLHGEDPIKGSTPSSNNSRESSAHGSNSRMSSSEHLNIEANSGAAFGMSWAEKSFKSRMDSHIGSAPKVKDADSDIFTFHKNASGTREKLDPPKKKETKKTAVGKSESEKSALRPQKCSNLHDENADLSRAVGGKEETEASILHAQEVSVEDEVDAYLKSSRDCLLKASGHFDSLHASQNRSQLTTSSCNFEYDPYVKPVRTLPAGLRSELSLDLGDSSAGAKGWSNERKQVEKKVLMSEAFDFEYSDSDSPTKSLPDALKAELALDLDTSIGQDSMEEKSQVKAAASSLAESRGRTLQGKAVQGSHGDRASVTAAARSSGDASHARCPVIQINDALSAVMEESGPESYRQDNERPQVEVAASQQDRFDIAEMEGELDVYEDEDEDEDNETDQAERIVYKEFLQKLANDPRFHSVGPGRARSVSPSKGRPQSAGAHGSLRPQSAVSKVRASIEKKPAPRRWEKSSVAWSTYGHGELRLRSSLSTIQALRASGGHPVGRPVSALGVRGDVGASQPSISKDASRATKHSRPASAGGKVRPPPRCAQPYNSAVYKKYLDPGDRPPEGLLKVKAISGKAAVKRHINTSAMDTYTKYIAMSPRVDEGDFSLWLCLPDEIWLHICDYLSQSDLGRIAQVCKQLQRISLDDSLWYKIVLKKQHKVNDGWLTEIGKKMPVQLHLVKCQGEKVTERGLRELFRQCADSLEELSITGCSHGYLTGDHILLHAALRCHNITVLDVSWCNVNDNGIAAISESSDRLESVCLNGCQSITDEAIRTLTDKHGLNLHTLECFGCFNLTPATISSITSNCKALITLNLGQCWKLTDSSLIQLSTSLKLVQNLDLRGCKQLNDTCIHQIVRNCPHLRSFSIANCPNITDAGMAEIGSRCTAIRTLDVCGCKKVTNIGVRSLAMNCQQLEYLDLSSTGVTHKGVTTLANYCSRQLEVLKVNFCKHITVASLAKLAKHCQRLKKIYLYGASGIRNVEEIKKEKPSLWIEM